MAKRSVTVLDRQTLWDIAVREHGGVEGVFGVLADNPHLAGIDTQIEAGQLLRVEAAPVDSDVATFMREQDYHPVTGELHVPPPCLGYPTMPDVIEVDGTMEGGPYVPPVEPGTRLAVCDIGGSGGSATTLLGRNTGNIAVYRGSGVGGGVEGSDWDIIEVEPGTIVQMTGHAGDLLCCRRVISTPAVTYASGKAFCLWLPAPTWSIGTTIRQDRGTINQIASEDATAFSPCRTWVLERSPNSYPRDFVPVAGPFLETQTDSGVLPTPGGAYQISWHASNGLDPAVHQGISIEVHS